MSAFTSRRETRLWLAAAVVAAAIFSTLGLAGVLAEAVPNRGLSDGLFVFGAFLVAVTVVSQGLRERPGTRALVASLGFAAVLLMVLVRTGIPVAERTHIIEYGVLAVFVHAALAERSRNGRRVPAPAILAFVVTTCVGGVDEGIQALIPGRVFDAVDIAFNAIAAFLSVSGIVVLGRARKWLATRKTG